MLTCVNRPPSDEKRFSHSVHEYMFSPVCFLTWREKVLLCVNPLSHTVHQYGLGLSSCGCSAISFSSFFTSNESPVYQHKQHCQHQFLMFIRNLCPCNYVYHSHCRANFLMVPFLSIPTATLEQKLSEICFQFVYKLNIL